MVYGTNSKTWGSYTQKCIAICLNHPNGLFRKNVSLDHASCQRNLSLLLPSAEALLATNHLRNTGDIHRQSSEIQDPRRTMNLYPAGPWLNIRIAKSNYILPSTNQVHLQSCINSGSVCKPRKYFEHHRRKSIGILAPVYKRKLWQELCSSAKLDTKNHSIIYNPVISHGFLPQRLLVIQPGGPQWASSRRASTNQVRHSQVQPVCRCLGSASCSQSCCSITDHTGH
jgi:hypothetical protein